MIHLGKNAIKSPITQTIDDMSLIVVLSVENANDQQKKKKANISGINLTKENWRN